VSIELADVEAPLALFAEGMAGRYFHIAPTSEFAGRRLQLGTDQSALVSDTLYLPERLDAPDASAYRVLALQQLGHLEFGTYAFDFAEAQSRLPGLPADTGKQSSARMSDYEYFYQRFPDPTLASRVLHLCERIRIDALMLRHYPGIDRHLRRYHAHLLQRDPPMPVFDLTTALYALDCATLGADAAQLEAMDATGALAGCHAIIAGIRQAPGDVYQAADACIRLLDHLAPLLHQHQAVMPLPFDEELNGPATWMQREARLDDWREDLATLDRNLLAIEILEGDEAVAGDAEGLQDGELRPEDIHLAALQQERDTLARRVDMERSAIRDALGKNYPNARSFRYDEWDYLTHSYRRRWCRLFEQRLEPDANEDLHALQALMRRHRPRVQKQLELIKPLGYQRVYRVADGDELDFNAVIQARQDRLAGQSPDERVYSRRERVQRDVCAAFLVDLSASTDDPVNPVPPVYGPEDDDDELPDVGHTSPHAPADEPPPRRIIDVQRDAMLIMSAALEGIGDSYGIYGFSGYGHDCVEYFVAKEPHERFSRATLAAIAGMKPKRSTRMGPAIRHGARKLIDSGCAMKVLIIISDGFPQDSDYGPQRGDHEYGLQDTARALREAQEKGVETFCITVDRSGHDYLRRMCPDARYLVIEDVEDLPEALTKVYRTLTG
jgi:hypothetical protein